MIKPDTFILKQDKDIKDLEKHFEYNKPEFTFLDVETDSEIEKKANLYGIGVCFDKDHEAFYIPWRHPDGKRYWSGRMQFIIKKLIKHMVSNSKLVNHNIIYDVLVLENNWGKEHDYTDHIYSDTILLHHTLNEEPPHGLKELAFQKFGPKAVKAQDELKEHIKAKGGKWTNKQKDMYMADTNILGEYCCWDVILTRKLFYLFESELKKDPVLYDLFYKEEIMPLYREVTINMKRKGFIVDINYYENLNKEITKDINKIEAAIFDEIGEFVYKFEQEKLDSEVPVKHTGDLPKILAKLNGIPLPVDKTGKTVLSEKALMKQWQATPKFAPFYQWVSQKSFKEELKQYKNGKTKVMLKSEPDKFDIPFSNGEIRYAQEHIFKERKNKDHIFNLNSGDHIGHLLFNEFKIEPWKFTDGGKSGVKKPCTDAEVIDKLIEDYKEEHPFLNILMDYRKLCKLRSTYIEGILERQIDGHIYTSMLQFGTTSGRYASRGPNCLSTDTEVLTQRGWLEYEDLKYFDKIACFDKDNEKITFEKYEKKWRSDLKTHNMIHVKNQHTDMLVTENHRCLFQNRKSGKYKTLPANEYLTDVKLLHGGNFEGKIIHNYQNDLNFLRLLVAVQADGELRADNRKRIKFVFNKKRKYDRLLYLINNNNYLNEYKESYKKGNTYCVTLYDENLIIWNILGKEKTFPSLWIQSPSKQRTVILEELFNWDGSFTRKNNYSSNNEKNIDLVQGLACLQGWRAHKRIYWSKRSKSSNFQLDFTRRNYSLTTNSLIEKQNITCEVWCVKVPTDYFIVRRGSDTFITGNCQNLPRIKDEDSGLSEVVLKYTNAIRGGFVAPKGYKIVNADYEQLEPKCFAHCSGDSGLRNIFHKGEDLYSRIAIDVFKIPNVSADKKAPNYLKKLMPEYRQKAKVFCLAVVYGAGAGRIAQSMGVDWEEAKRVIKAYLDAYPELKKYMRRCDIGAINKGQVKTDFGRIRHLSSAEKMFKKYGWDIFDKKWAKRKNLETERFKLKNLMNNAKNFPIQGMAAHIVNRAAIKAVRAFKEANLDGWLALQVHDELTCIFREDHAEKAAELLQHSMETAVTISVPLSAEPLIADNWGEAK